MQAYLLSTALKGRADGAGAGPLHRQLLRPDSPAEFDQKLVDVLGYRVPGDLARMSRRWCSGTRAVRCRACSTSVVGPAWQVHRCSLRRASNTDRRRPFTPYAGRRLGVGSVATRRSRSRPRPRAFLEPAVRRRTYDLGGRRPTFLVYFGDLSPLCLGDCPRSAAWQASGRCRSRPSEDRGHPPSCPRGGSRMGLALCRTRVRSRSASRSSRRAGHGHPFGAQIAHALGAILRTCDPLIQKGTLTVPTIKALSPWVDNLGL